ncbi:hypothetical protein ABN028_16035 [Actinopolymorpha sp. B17G11]|uniref:hypothetical protein n=1 Tax=Actinopolymorpha sp. B17G11 TaxID=3160861 RepID=UPI0032E465AF
MTVAIVTILVTALIIGFLYSIARNFSRWTLRLTTFVVVLAAIGIGVGLNLGSSPAGATAGTETLERRTVSAYDEIASRLFSPLYELHDVPHSRSASIAFLLIFGIVYWRLEVAAARRETPRVNVDGPDRNDTPATRRLLNRLKVKLPAIAVPAPPTMPGGSHRAHLATVVEASDVTGGRVMAAVMRLSEWITPSPPTYIARLRAEPTKSGPLRDDTPIDLIVDLRDKGSGDSLAVKAFPPVPFGQAADRAAGFVASRLFSNDPSKPKWVTRGRWDGDDLTAYLLSLRPRRLELTYEAMLQNRRDRIELLKPYATDGPAADVARYELASLHELEGEELDAVRLHALTRAHAGVSQNLAKGIDRSFGTRTPCRLGMSLSMLANRWFQEKWQGSTASEAGPETAERIRSDMFQYLSNAGMLTKQFEGRDLVNPRNIDEVRLELLQMAQIELGRYRDFTRWRRRVWVNLTRREWRSDLRGTIGVTPCAILERWDRRHLARLAIQIVQARLVGPHWCAGGPTPSSQGCPTCSSTLMPEAEPDMRPRADQRLLAWLAGRDPVSWQEKYNRVCLYAVKNVECHEEACPSHDAAAATAVKHIGRLVTDPECDLDHPSEWIAVDPDLRCLHRVEGFTTLVEGQLRRDFPNGLGNVSILNTLTNSNEEWLRRRLRRTWLHELGPPRPLIPSPRSPDSS